MHAQTPDTVVLQDLREATTASSPKISFLRKAQEIAGWLGGLIAMTTLSG